MPEPHPQTRHETLGPLRWRVLHWPAAGRVARPPQALLLHGTGSSAASWRALAPLLAQRHEVFAPDLPGHAETRVPAAQALSLPFIAQALARLCEHLQLQPRLLVGHSAGAAIAARLCLDGALRPQRLVAINGALLPLDGPAAHLYSPIARTLVAQPLVPHLFAWHAQLPGVVERLLQGTGSRLAPEDVRHYRGLVTDASHAAGALRMMAAWDLAPLEAALPELPVPLVLLVGGADRVLPPSHADRIRRRLPAATLQVLPGLGHLAHEEDARAVQAAIESAIAAPAAGPGRRRTRGTAPAAGGHAPD
jgi:magnesium chelatase accessory protein